MGSVESKGYSISAENASSHRDIKAEYFLPQGESFRPSNNLLAQTCNEASRREKIQVVSKPQEGVIPGLTVTQIAERLILFGADKQAAEQMAESLEESNWTSVSLVSGYWGGTFFAAIVERPELPESLQLPYKIKWTVWQSKLP